MGPAQQLGKIDTCGFCLISRAVLQKRQVQAQSGSTHWSENLRLDFVNSCKSSQIIRKLQLSIFRHVNDDIWEDFHKDSNVSCIPEMISHQNTSMVSMKRKYYHSLRWLKHFSLKISLRQKNLTENPWTEKSVWQQAVTPTLTLIIQQGTEVQAFIKSTRTNHHPLQITWTEKTALRHTLSSQHLETKGMWGGRGWLKIKDFSWRLHQVAYLESTFCTFPSTNTQTNRIFWVLALVLEKRCNVRRKVFM